jgi:hypothetical protein
MSKFLLVALASTALAALCAAAQQPLASATQFQAVPELPYRVVPNFFKFPKGTIAGEASAVAVNSKGHIFLFQRTKPMLAENDAKGNFVQSLGDGLLSHPHALGVDSDDNLWTTDDGNHLVLKLNPAGNVLLVLGRINTGAEANWLFNKPADVAFARNGDIYVADGYGNSRVVKFDRYGNIKAWGKFGAGIGEFNLPHAVAVDNQGRLLITPDQHIWMVDGGYDRVIELDQNGKILGAFGEPGHKPGQFAWAHFMALGPDQTIYVADVLNWRFQAFAHTAPSGVLTSYIPSVRMFWGSTPSVGWTSQQTAIPFQKACTRVEPLRPKGRRFSGYA